jgi:polysaccharide deacetylase 2 family uncharacterized protein YibQ
MAEPPLDDLDTPLGQNAPARRRFAWPTRPAPAAATLLGGAVVGFVIWAAVVHDPLGGEPLASAAIPLPETAEARAKELPKEQPKPGPAKQEADRPAGTQTVTIIDGSTGKRQEVTITGPAAAEPKRASADPRLLEASRHGPIPRIAPDGTRPSDLYARKAAAEKANPDGPQIAIVIGGLGISATSTADALSKLPGPVTFAFTPYGSGLDTLVARARDRGHEILLQVPMEPHDYPDNDPGPQTLLVTLSAKQNIDRLHWLFSRLQGYVGITNFMGARFTSADAAIAPVLREVARRGLIYVDDGSSPRSQAQQIAGANKVPFARADIVIDAVPGPAEIDNALKRLESAARDRGVAVGYSSALPAAIDRIAKWAKAAQGRGIVLVPITTAAVKAKSS